MPRARGANAQMALAFENIYGTAPAGGFHRVPFVSANLGDDTPLQPANILGFGREPQQPDRGPTDNAGDVVVPMDARNIGYWLKMMLGDPVTVEGLPAKGGWTFSAQPAATKTITANGQAFTFVAGDPGANEIKIGATLIETVANAVRALNASVVAGVAAATYRAAVKGNGIEVTYDALGVGGNAYTLAAEAGSNATVSAATLTGGAAAGAQNHTFVSGALEVPSASIELGFPEVPSYPMNSGAKLNTFSLPMQRSGQLDATLNLICQGEYPAGSSQAGVLDELAIQRFSQFSGYVLRNGVPVADLVTGQFTFGNGLDPVPSLRGDGRVGGVDEGGVTVGMRLGIRWSGRDLDLAAESGEPIALELVWSIPDTNWTLRIHVHHAYLPKPKKSVGGPGAIQADYDCQGAEHPTLGRSCTVVLTNDVASYD